MIEHPFAAGPIIIGIAIGVIFRVLWVFACEKPSGNNSELMFRK